MNNPLTATAVEKMRRWAKQQARERAIPYGQALEDAARSAGFGSWHEVCKAQRSAAPAGSGLELPVDPALPPRFDDTPNESRSKAELDAWWLRPFAQSRPDGGFDVRCLDGGAWDRATYYGTAKDLAEAREVARAKLNSWLVFRDSPILLLLGSDVAMLTLEPNRPGMPRPVLFAAGSLDDLGAVRNRWDELGNRDPDAAALVIRAARERSAQVPTYDQVEAAAARAGALFLSHPDGVLPSLAEVAVLVALRRFAEPGSSQVRFTLPELAVYLWEFGLDEENIGPVFARARRLQLEGKSVIVDAQAQVRDGIDQWRVQLADSKWPGAYQRRES